MELAMIVAAAKALPAALDASLNAVDSIRTRLAHSTDAKKQVIEQLDQMRQSLGSVGELATAANAYLVALEEIRALDMDAMIAERYIEQNGAALQNRMNAIYNAAWETIDNLVDAIDRSRSLLTAAHLDSQHWFDVSDDLMINSRLHDASLAFVKVQEHAAKRVYVDLKFSLAEMRKPLYEVDVLLHTTLTHRILDELEHLRSAPNNEPTAAGRV